MIGKSPAVSQIWAEFESSCSRALTDPGGFLNEHPTTGASGEKLVARSPDGQVVALYFLNDQAVYRHIGLIGVPGELTILCEASGGDAMADIGSWPALQTRREAEIREVFAAFPGAVVVGGAVPSYGPFTDMPGGMPDAVTHGIQIDLASKKRLVIANVLGDTVNLSGIYSYDPNATISGQTVVAAEPPPLPPEPEAKANPAAAMRAVAEVCLRNYRTPDAALPALEAAGMTLSTMGGKTFEISAPGIWGIVDPGPELYCTVQSPEVSLEVASAMATELAHALFPGLVQPGAPEGGNGPCDRLSIFAPRQLIWLRYAQAGNSGDCINDGTSAIIIN